MIVAIVELAEADVTVNIDLTPLVGSTVSLLEPSLSYQQYSIGMESGGQEMTVQPLPNLWPGACLRAGLPTRSLPV